VTRRVRLVSLLIALMALSGAYAAPGSIGVARRTVASIAWSRSDRAQVQVRWREAQQHRTSTGPAVVSHGSAGSAPTPSIDLPLSRFQRPPPAHSIA
jgi:hypothetical protein